MTGQQGGGEPAEVSEAALDRAVASVFGRESAAPVDSVSLFERAGFCREDAERGAQLLESGLYFGFADVATSMGIFDQGEFLRRNPGVSEARIREVAESLTAAPEDGTGVQG